MKNNNAVKGFLKSWRRVIAMVGVILLLTVFITVTALAVHFEEIINTFFGGVRYDGTRIDAALLRSESLAEEIAREGILLLRNENVDGTPVLPLSSEEIESGTINVFGWRGTGYQSSPISANNWNGGWIMSGSGSGQAGAGSTPIRLLDSLSMSGFDWNRELMQIARDYRANIPSDPAWNDSWSNLLRAHPHRFFRLWEPPVSNYTPAVMNRALNHSDIAMVVIGRLGGEGRDLPTMQFSSTANPSVSGSNALDPLFEIDYSRHYLELTAREEELLELVSNAGFAKTILLLNTCNHFELNFLENDPRFNIDAAISVGPLGTFGAIAIPQILKGYRYETIPILDEYYRPTFNNEGEAIVEIGPDGNPIMRRVDFSPSGRTVNTWPRRMQYDPVFLNSGQNYTHGSDNGGNVRHNRGHHGAIPHLAGGLNGEHYIDYEENIFLGYRYFETRAYEERRNGNYSWHSNHVQFPFGFGLSFTEFEWSVGRITADGTDVINGNPTIRTTTIFEVDVYIYNAGNWPGQDVVQIYINVPFHRDQVNPLEKSYVMLVDFAKTGIIEPGTMERLTLSFDAYDFASYDTHRRAVGRTDAWDGGFVLEQGTYQIRIQTDSHNLAKLHENNSPILNAVTEFTIPSTLVFNQTRVITCEWGGASRTLYPARNRFTGMYAEAGIPIDGTPGVGNRSRTTALVNDGAGIHLMSRLNFEATFPRPTFNSATSIRNERRAPHYTIAAGWFSDNDWGVYWGCNQTWTDHPLTPINSFPQTGSLSMRDPTLLKRLGADFNHPDWNRLLNQMSIQDIYDLVQRGGYITTSIDSIDLPMRWNLDGPSGLNFGNQSIQRTPWTAFPVSTVVGQTWSQRLAFFKGLAVGEEAAASGVGGWYAPGVNLHRGPFAGRNFEYFSEDPVHSGIMAAEITLGALQNGLYCYVKHFVANDSETHRGGLRTWMSEQTLRELYLRPFEIAVRRGRASGMMSGFNMIGALWTGGSRALNTYILREEWGFRGAVVTDYFDGGASANHMSASQGLRAGNDLWLSGIGGGAGEDAEGYWLPAGPRGSFIWFNSADRAGPNNHTNMNFNASGRILLRRSSHNILFAIANSFWYANTAEPNYERFGSEVWQFVSDYRHEIIEGQRTFPWFWIWGILPIYIFLLAGIGLLLYFFLVKYILARKKAKAYRIEFMDSEIANKNEYSETIDDTTIAESPQDVSSSNVD